MIPITSYTLDSVIHPHSNNIYAWEVYFGAQIWILYSYLPMTMDAGNMLFFFTTMQLSNIVKRMSSTVSGTQLQSSVERPCPGERMKFTCTMLLDISGVFYPLTSLKLSMLATDMNSFFDPPFEFGVFMVDQGTPLHQLQESLPLKISMVRWFCVEMVLGRAEHHHKP